MPTRPRTTLLWHALTRGLACVLAVLCLAACGANGTTATAPPSAAPAAVAVTDAGPATEAAEEKAGEASEEADEEQEGKASESAAAVQEGEAEPGEPSGAADEGTVGDEALETGGPTQGRPPVDPCTLVTQTEAGKILSVPIARPVKAAQGPTCIYRGRTGGTFVTLAVVARPTPAPKGLRERKRVRPAGRAGWCGTRGRPVLDLRVADGRTLTVTAPCDVATRFAARAVRRLED